ncbi:hypothetical protein CHS0354_042626 [Potamilus streckersoni]|uniref:C-type lectin domain-containing protein n=1 Tax=Potamilus streckersoni TaxID=2493646 RepID=A0AAE0TES8_9BIVA|nr:hypothetical protein CHS0354_042626 [Potamilus streckersoni]
MILLELITIILVFFSLGVHGACDSLWHESGDHCYYVGMKNFGISWSESENECLKMGGHLASIESASEYDVILDYLMLYSFSLNDYAWIGLNDVAVESKWVWSDGTIYNSAVSRWQIGQPNDGSCGFWCIGNQDCVAIVKDFCQMKWNDKECSGSFYIEGSRSFFVCKKEGDPIEHLTVAVTTIGQAESMVTGELNNAACDPLWYESGDHCYYVGMKTSSITWRYSENECLNMGGHLASIESTSEYNVILGYLMLYSFTINDYAWIGLNDVAVESKWVWSDGTIYNAAVSRWQNGQPNDGSCDFWCIGNQDCVAIVSDICQMKWWDDRECSGSFYIEGSRSFFVCKKGLSPTTRSNTSAEVIATVAVKTTDVTETTTLDNEGINNASNEATRGSSTTPIGRVTTSEETTLGIENGSAGAVVITSTSRIQVPAAGAILTTTEARSYESTMVESSTSTSLYHSSFSEPEPTIDTKCFCKCSSLLRKGNMTRQELADFVRQLTEELTVNKSTLSSTRRQLTSAPDERPSSIAIGSTFAIVIMCCVFCPIVIIDILRCIKWIWN